MANNCKRCFNAQYQPHCHPTTNSLWLCSSVHCGPPHQSRRIWLSAEADNQKWVGLKLIHPLWLSDAIWQHKSGATLAQVMSCCRMTPIHYLNQCSLKIIGLHSSAISEKNLPNVLAKVIVPIWIFNDFMHLPGVNELTHWGKVMHIFVSELTTIGSDNGFLPGWSQALIWTSAGMLLIGHPGTNFSEILIKIYTFSLKKRHFTMPSVKWWPFCHSPIC